MIQRGTDQVLTLELYAENGVTELVPTAAAVKVYAANTLVADLTATPGVISTATLPGATTDGLDLADDWLEVWTVTVDGETHTLQRSASLVRRVLHPTVTVTDLQARAPQISKVYGPDLGTLLRTSWEYIQRDLMQRGNRPQLILEPSALHEPHLSKALHIAYETVIQRVGSKYEQQAARYRDLYERQMGALSYRYDSDLDGASTEGDKAATPSFLLTNLHSHSGRY